MITVEVFSEDSVDVEVGAIVQIKSSDGKEVEIGSGLKLEGNVLSVDTADNVEEDNTKPVTSAAVYTVVGNINAILEQL